jgi:hypothetical protein
MPGGLRSLCRSYARSTSNDRSGTSTSTSCPNDKQANCRLAAGVVERLEEQGRLQNALA